jgi:hypothetical protein
VYRRYNSASEDVSREVESRVCDCGVGRGGGGCCEPIEGNVSALIMSGIGRWLLGRPAPWLLKDAS